MSDPNDPHGMQGAARIGEMVRDLRQMGLSDHQIAAELIEVVAILAFRSDASNILVRRKLDESLAEFPYPEWRDRSSS